jgi:flavin reductase (DIM6/NTAB) family NADH-FMN oxidoreductase RutF
LNGGRGLGPGGETATGGGSSEGRADSVVGPIPPGRDPDAYDRLRRRVLWSLPTGLFVVGSRAGTRRNLMTGNWVMQVAVRPKLVAVSVQRGSVTSALIGEGGGFSVSVLPRSDRSVVRRFVKPVEAMTTDADGAAVTLQGVRVFEVEGGLPCLRSAVSWLSCRVRHTEEWESSEANGPSSHLLFVGEVVDAGQWDAYDPDAGAPEVLRMEDTRMSYGG